MKNLALVACSVLLLITNLVYAVSGSSAKDPADIRGGKCQDNHECYSRLNLAAGFLVGSYNEKERLNSIICEAQTAGSPDVIQCAVIKFASEAKDGCYQKTNIVTVNFTKASFLGQIPMPIIASQTGFQYSCEN
jgi:hypothetical protein